MRTKVKQRSYSISVNSIRYLPWERRHILNTVQIAGIRGITPAVKLHKGANRGFQDEIHKAFMGS